MRCPEGGGWAGKSVGCCFGQCRRRAKEANRSPKITVYKRKYQDSGSVSESSVCLHPRRPSQSSRLGATMASPLDLPAHPDLTLPTIHSPWSDCLRRVSEPDTVQLKTFHTASLVLLHPEQNPRCSGALQALDSSSQLHSCSICLFQLSHAEHFTLH